MEEVNEDPKIENVCIVVLGDIGRSPRMQYHALSLAKAGHKVDLIGYGETEPFDDLKRQPLLSYHYLLAYPNLPVPRILNYVLKTLWQAITLSFLLFITRRPGAILVQNPPAVPSLLVCLLFKYMLRAKLIIDWHNYAHSNMALSLGPNHLLVKITKWVERFAGRRADVNLCVTNHMKNDLLKNWKVAALTLHDKPPSKFAALSVAEKHDFLNKLSQEYPVLLSTDKSSNVFTQEREGEIILKPDRPGMLVSSTSWSEDEDFSILFSALKDYENHIKSGNALKLPSLFCIITGKGPLKDYYSSKIMSEDWKHVTVLMPWLEDQDYPKLLASADLGVSLHVSSSGMDLPMKVVDMFGCTLPVCAYNFVCLHELVQDGENGYTFTEFEELSSQIKSWFENFPNNNKQKEIEKQFKANLQTFQQLRWDENWQNVTQNHFSEPKKLK